MAIAPDLGFPDPLADFGTPHAQYVAREGTRSATVWKLRMAIAPPPPPLAHVGAQGLVWVGPFALKNYLSLRHCSTRDLHR